MDGYCGLWSSCGRMTSGELNANRQEVELVFHMGRINVVARVGSVSGYIGDI